MAITLKLNSGGFVRCLTRSDLELTKKKKIPLATKQLNYTDHKHFFTKPPPSKHCRWLPALRKRERDSYHRTQNTCLSLRVRGEEGTKNKKRERKALLFCKGATGAPPATATLYVSHRAAPKVRGGAGCSVDKPTLLSGRRARRQARKLPFGGGLLYLDPDGIFLFSFFFFPTFMQLPHRVYLEL